MNVTDNSILKLEKGFYVIRVSLPRDLLREAQIMGNCLNDFERFADSEIYSLRNSCGRPLANIEIREGLLIQISGPENKCVKQEYLPHLRKFLSDRGIPKDDINSRLGFIEFDGQTFATIDACTDAFAVWCELNTIPCALPFQQHPKIKEFLNIFARYGQSSKNSTRVKVARLFTPNYPAWRDGDQSINGNSAICRPRLATALHHLTRYGALPQSTRNTAFRVAIADIAAKAVRQTTIIYDISAENRIFHQDSFADLLELIQVREIYDTARDHARDVKAKALKGTVPREFIYRLEQDFLTL